MSLSPYIKMADTPETVSEAGADTAVLPESMKVDVRPVPVSLFRIDRKTDLEEGEEDVKIRPWLKIPALGPIDQSGPVLVKMEKAEKSPENVSAVVVASGFEDSSKLVSLIQSDEQQNGTDSRSSTGVDEDSAVHCSDNEDNISSVADSVKDDIEEKSPATGVCNGSESDDMGVVYADKSISLEDLSASVGPTLLVNGSDIYYKCRLCFKVFSTEQRWKRHKQDTHFNPRLHACDICGERFKRSTHLKRHRDRRHIPQMLNPVVMTISDKRRFACTQCPRVFERRNKLLAHIQQYHQNKRPFRCTDCNEGFKRQDHLNRHKESKAHKLRVILATKSEAVAIGLADDVISCPNLPKEMMDSFVSYSSPKSGRVVPLNKTDKPSPSEDSASPSNSSLERSPLKRSMEINNRTPVKVEPSERGMKISNVTSLEVEPSSSGNGTPVRFELDSSFSITPSSEGSEPGETTPAGMSTNANESYIDDKQTTYNEYLSDSMNDSGVLMNSSTTSSSGSIGQCPCYLCGKKFESEKRMKIHLRQTHSSERRHVCKLCGERFKRSTHLRRHMSSNKHLRLSQANGKLESKSKSAFGPPLTGWQEEMEDPYLEVSDSEALSIMQPSGSRRKQRKNVENGMGLSLASAYYDDYEDIPVSMVPRSLPRPLPDDSYDDMDTPYQSTNQSEAMVILSRDNGAADPQDGALTGGVMKSTLRSLLQTNIVMRDKHQLTTASEVEYSDIPLGDDGSLSDMDIKEYIIDLSHYRAVRPWECKLCRHGFTVRNNLVTHIKQVHTSLRPHRCDLCSEGFKRIQHLKKHRERIHGYDNTDFQTACENVEPEVEEVPKPVNRRKKSRPRKVINNIEADIDGMNGFGTEDDDDENAIIAPSADLLENSSFQSRADVLEYINQADSNDDPAMILLDTEHEDSLDPESIDFAHNNTIVNRNNFECKICRKLFSARPNLYTHLRQCHQNVRPFTCKFCGEQFKRGTHLRIHISRKHYGAGNRENGDLEDMEAEESIVDSDQGGITPPSTVSLYPEHSQILHHSLPRIHPGVWKCTRCPKSFPRKDLFQHHMKMHVAAEKCACPFCDKTFLHEKSLKEHLKAHEDQPRFICSLCNVSFLLNSAYLSHMKIHKEEDGDRIPGAIGDIAEDSQLVSVILQTVPAIDSEDSNSSERDILPLKSRKLQAAKTDETPSETGSGSREVIVTLEKACAVCNDEFEDMESLRAHTRGHRKPYCCQYCSKKYDNISYLERHTRVHTGSKPYRCSICNRGFPRKERAEDHIVKYH